jgi:hypothetical protein
LSIHLIHHKCSPRVILLIRTCHQNFTWMPTCHLTRPVLSGIWTFEFVVQALPSFHPDARYTDSIDSWDALEAIFLKQWGEKDHPHYLTEFGALKEK